MPRQVTRSGWLAIFAACNLVFWTVVALAVGVLASEQVNLGIEAAMRQYRATAVASWQRLSTTLLATTDGRDDTPQDQSLVRDGATVVADAYITRPAGATPQPRAQTEQSAAEAAPVPSGQDAPLLPADGMSQSSAGVISQPLVIVDPDLDTLAQLGAEMSRSAPRRPVLIRYGVATLNRQIAALLASDPEFPYRNAQVDLSPDQVTLTAELTVLGLQVQAKIRGTVAIVDCRPRADIEAVTVAGVPAPRFVSDYVEETLQEAMAWYPSDYPLCLERIAVEQDQATIFGYRR